MTTSQRIVFEVVLNGISETFPSDARSIFLLDGYPDLLHIINYQNYIISYRDGKQFNVIKYNKNNGVNWYGNGLRLVAHGQEKGYIVTCTNGVFKHEDVVFPELTGFVSCYYRVHDMAYLLEYYNSQYHLVYVDTSKTLMTIQVSSRFCFLGMYFIVFSSADKQTTLNIHYLHANLAVSIRSFNDALNTFTALEDRCETVGYRFNCTARRREDSVELFVSTSNNLEDACRIYKAFFPIKGFSVEQHEGRKQITPLEDENAALKLENAEVKEKVALLERSITSLEEDKKALEEQMAALQKKYSRMLIMMHGGLKPSEPAAPPK